MDITTDIPPDVQETMLYPDITFDQTTFLTDMVKH
jgi:hypothetical protein